jgi:hypothetical protein
LIHLTVMDNFFLMQLHQKAVHSHIYPIIFEPKQILSVSYCPN